MKFTISKTTVHDEMNISKFRNIPEEGHKIKIVIIII